MKKEDLKNMQQSLKENRINSITRSASYTKSNPNSVSVQDIAARNFAGLVCDARKIKKHY